MALKLYDKLTPSGDFPLVGAGDVELPGGKRLANLLTDTETEVLAAQEITGFVLDENFGYCRGLEPSIFTTPLVVGKKYSVAWEGEPYTDLEAYTVTNETFGELVTIGDGTSLGYPGNGEPFVIAMNEGVALFLAFLDDAESHNVAVSEVAVKVNESCLPEEKKPASIDLTNYASNGVIVETYADGSTFTYTMEFNADGKPVKVTDSGGNVTTLDWGGE